MDSSEREKMDYSNNTIERMCRLFGYLDFLEKQGAEFVSSGRLAEAIGVKDHTIRKDVSFLGVTGFGRKGYKVAVLKERLGGKLNLNGHRKACIVGLGRLGSALLDYEKFKDDGFDIVAGFDRNINKIERLKTPIDVFAVTDLEDVVRARDIEMGIIAVPSDAAQDIADRLVKAGVRGVLNFSPVELVLPEDIIYSAIDMTTVLRCIAARFN